MTKSIEKRLASLEQTKASSFRPTIPIMIPHGTNEEMDAFEEQCRKDYPDKDIFFARVVPAVGETMNEFRKSQGLEPMDIKGWD